jgi:hypothetical protein
MLLLSDLPEIHRHPDVAAVPERLRTTGIRIGYGRRVR